MCIYENIIFDLGGVIEKINPDGVVNAFQDLGIKGAENIFTLFKQSVVCSEFEVGNLYKEDFIFHLKEMCKPSIPGYLIELAWCSNQGGVTEKTLAVLEKLKNKGINLFVLSNTNPIHAQTIENNFYTKYFKEFKSLFNAVYYSFEMRLRKPDLKAYMYLLNQSGLDPNTCIYIDDLAVNIEVPQQLGMHCICPRTNDEIEDIQLLSNMLD